MNAKAPRTKVNWPIVISVTITYLFMIGTAAVSFWHIVTVSTALGLGWEAFTVPFLIDGLAILGLIGRSPKRRKGIRQGGLLLVTIGGALSLACNVMAGDTIGRKAYGVLIVGVFVISEWYSGKLREEPAKVQPVGRTCPAGCLCGKHKPRRAPAKGKTKRATPKAPRPSQRVAELEAAYAMPSAPVSGA